MSNKPENSTIINVCIIPPEEIGNKCVGISQALKSDKTRFVLDGKSRFAHMTAYMARFADNQISNVIAATKNALKNTAPFLCEHSGYFINKGGYFEISYKKSDSLIRLHEKLIDDLKEYRINPGDPFEEGYFTPYTPDQQKNAKETGYDLAYNLYRPHITLTRYKEGQAPVALPEISPKDLSFKASKICVYKADDNGAIYGKLAEFTL